MRKPKVKTNNVFKSMVASWKTLWKYLKLSKKQLIIILCTAIIASASSLYAIYTTGTFLNDVFINLIGNKEQNIKIDGALNNFLFTIGMIAGAYAINFTCSLTQTFLLVRISQNTGYHMRYDLFNKLQKVSISYLDTQSTGNLMSCFTNDVDIVVTSLSQTINQIIMATVTLVGVVFMLFIINPLLATISLVATAILFYFITIFIRKSQPYYVKMADALGNITSDIEEYNSAHKMITAFGCQKKVHELFAGNIEIYRATGVKAQVISGLVFPYNSFINNLVVSLITIVIVLLLIFAKDLMHIGLIEFSGAAIAAVYLLLLRQATSQVSTIMAQFNLIQLTTASLIRIQKIISTADEPITNDNKAIAVTNPEIAFKNLHFSYVPGVKVLNDINFVAKPNTMNAIVGPTGSGKTTIISLLSAFYNLDSGSIEIGGQDISQFSKHSVRDNITVVMQDSFIFSGTIYENIRYGRLNATNKEIIQAATLSSADKFISKLPQGYNTHISNHSDDLSEGEKQLISIARAFLSNAKILVLDEATSYVDTKTEKDIQAAMRTLMKNKTSIVIAHRLSTIMDADNIVVIKDGIQIESGNHHKLMENKQFYYKLNTAMDQDFDDPADN